MRMQFISEGLGLLRVMFPPWQMLHDPLVQYETRPHARARARSWGLLVVAYVTVLSLIIYLAGILASDDFGSRQPLTQELLPELGTLLGTGLVTAIVLAHWGLMLAIFSRTARLISGRRQNRQWELIAVSPLPRARWLKAQLATLGWQIFPLVRQLLVLHGLMVLLGAAFLLPEYYQSWQRQADSLYSYGNLLPPWLFVLLNLPVVLALVFFPLVEAALMGLVGLYSSALAKRPNMAILYSFFNFFLARLSLAFTLFYGGTLVLWFFALLLTDEIDLADLDMIFGVFYCCMVALLSAFVLEGFPALTTLMLAIPKEDNEQVALYLSFFSTGLLVYLLLPLYLMQRLYRRTTRVLETRER